MSLNEIEAGVVHVLQIQVPGDVSVEESELQDHFTKCAGHLAVQLSSHLCLACISFWFHMI